MQQHCSEKMFLCRKDNICINFIYVCDRLKDCPSGEDEIGCEFPVDEVFTCLKNNENISHNHVCDFISDCQDGSDEYSCRKLYSFLLSFIPLISFLNMILFYVKKR